MRRLRDVDTAERVQVIQAALWGLGVGATLCVPVGAHIWIRWGWPFPVAILVSFVVIGGLVFGISWSIAQNAGRAAGTLHNPSGHSTPYRQEYSRAAALAIRGDYEHLE